MLLLDKQTAFFAGDLTGISTPNREALRIKGTGAILAEHDVALESPAIGTRPCFVGAHSYMNNGGYIRTGGGVFIGRYCSIGRRVTLAAGVHATAGLSTSPSLRRKGRPYVEADGVRPDKRQGQLVIGSDVWIGDGAIVMSGVTIGVGAIIGANAVVTRNVAPYAVVGGVPAKVIGRRFDEALAGRLMESRWWECGKAYLDTLPHSNVFEFLDAFRFEAASEETYAL